jgi:sugar phosphate isomerase/epimerase
MKTDQTDSINIGCAAWGWRDVETTATGQRVARIMAGVRSPAVGVNYDPANFLNQGTDPLMALRYSLPWVNYSHWKDVRWVDGHPQFCAFGEGEIVWQPILETLLESGYQGH